MIIRDNSRLAGDAAQALEKMVPMARLERATPRSTNMWFPFSINQQRNGNHAVAAETRARDAMEDQ